MAVEQKTLFPIQYKLFNIFTGEEVALKKNMDPRAQVSGKILVASTLKTNNWYYYKENPDLSRLGNKVTYKDRMEYLNDYRKRLFTEYGQLGYFDKIVEPWVKKTIYMVGANKSLAQVRPLDAGKLVSTCSTNPKQCSDLIYFDDMSERLLKIVQQHQAKVAPEELKKKLEKGKNIELSPAVAATTVTTTPEQKGGVKKRSPNKNTYKKVIIL